MKIKTVILGFLAATFVLLISFTAENAKTAEKKLKSDSANSADSAVKQWPVSRDPSDERRITNIGVVSVRKIFQECRRNASYRQQAAAEQDSIIAELQRLSGQIESEREGLKTLKEGSSDYMARFKDVLEKQANLGAQQEFHKQQIELKDQRWTEELYNDILKEVGKVAKQKGLALVFEKDEVELPAPTANELMMTIRTHKLLYSGGCVDITAEVIAGLDATEN